MVVVSVDRSVGRYIVDLVEATRTDARLKLGVSPRGSLMLFRAAQGAAYCAGRDLVLPDDVQRLAGTSKGEIIADLLQRVKVPT